MKIKVNYKEKKAVKVPVRIVKPIWVMTDEELIKSLDLKNKIIAYHYDVEQEYHKVDDIYSDGLVEYVSDLLYDYCQEPEFDEYDEYAKRLISSLEEEVVDEIYDLDDNAKEEK